MLNKSYLGLSVTVLSALLAVWPNWLWMAKRLSDGSDEPWGIVALTTIIVLLGKEIRTLQQPGDFTLTITALWLVIAIAVWGVIPPIFSTACAVLGITWLLSGLLTRSQPRLPLLMLALLALPLTASLNFYLGYPLRWLCAQAVAPLLSVFGITVTPQGAALLWNGKSVLIDAPCAGIAMLWLGMYLAALFSYLNSASSIRSLINGVVALMVVVLANVFRNALLFYKEAGIVKLPHWAHEAIGLVVFSFIVLLIYWLTSISNRKDICHESR